MIEWASVKNFRCLRDVETTLAPFTVLVGPNGSGKTAFLDAIDPSPRAFQTDFWRHRDRFDVTLRLTGGKRLSSTKVGWKQGWSDAFRYQRLHLDLLKLREENALQFADGLASDGSNLANVFGTCTRQQQTALATRFCQLVPMFSDVDVVPTNRGGYHTLRFHDRWEPSLHHSPDGVSDGTMLMVAFLALQYQQARVDVIAIEEPERGLHPYLIEQLVDMLRSMSTGALGPRPIQVMLATHSAELLEYVRPEEVRFFSRRSDDGSTEITAIDTKAPDWERSFHEHRESLGSAWLSGGLGGVPGG
ncbi:MAG: AAA family ATPase [Polyangiaceae bacterium]